MNTPDTEFADHRTGARIRRVTVGPLETNCWVVFDPHTNDTIVIDPGDEAQRLIDATADLRVRHIVLTHTHWDHVLGVPHVSDHYGVIASAHPDDAPVWPHEQRHLQEHGHFDAGTATQTLLDCNCTLRPADNEPLWTGATNAVRHGDTLECGAASMRVLATPGHTPGSISLVHGDRVFTGDTLFPGGPGLTGWPLSDFPTIISSITTQLLGLPDATIVHPGHGRDTTIGTERPALPHWIRRGW
jgi:hydroxyacylglutathione hydrolase